MFDMDSTPPATTASAAPVEIRRYASAIDWSPDPHSRLTVKAGTRAGTPARSAATRDRFTASGGCAMLPKMTWSSAAGSKPVRARSSVVTIRARCCAGTSFSSVPALAYGVRTPSTTTTSRDMGLLGRFVHGVDQVAVAVLEHAPLHLERRRDRPVLDREIRRQKGEGPDLL